MTAPTGGPGGGPVGGAASAGAAAARADDARLRQAARQLTGVFAQQLFKAMRATVPEGEGVVSGGSGESMFTGMLDEHLAGATPGRPAAAGADDGPGAGPGAAWTRSLAEAVFRRMRPGLPAAAPAPGAAPAPLQPPQHAIPLATAPLSSASVTPTPGSASTGRAQPPVALPDRR